MANKAPEENLQILAEVATALGPWKDQVVFIGGAVVGLLVTDPAAAPIRHTEDVDLVVGATTQLHYRQVDGALLGLGFRNDPDRHRWSYRLGRILVDVLPSEPAAFGLKGQWTKAALEHNFSHPLAAGIDIKVVAAAYFLALKLEAFSDRGSGDFLHKDIEDIITLIDGRDELLSELSGSRDATLKTFVREHIRTNKTGLLDSAQGHIGGGAGERLRLPNVRNRIEELAQV